MNALRTEIGGRATSTALLDKIAALHAKELKDLRFEVTLYRKEAFRLQNENDELRSQVESLRGQQARNVSPATTISALTAAASTLASAGKCSNSGFYQQAPAFVMQPSSSGNSNNHQNTPTRVRQHVKLPTARRPASSSSTGARKSAVSGENKKGVSRSNSPLEEDDGDEEASDAKSFRLSFPLEPPLPRKFQGDREAALEEDLPVFDAIVNFPNPCTESATGRRQCTMCGVARAFHVKAENKDEAVIPNQNKGVCTACDTKVWVVKATAMQVKWCKGCKNFQCWASFGDKGWATKCCACRKRMADSYAAKKEQKKARVL